VKVIFTLPAKLQGPGYESAAPSQWPKNPLAYIEWFTPQGTIANRVHGMYKISKAYDSQGHRQGTVIPLSNICQSCMLFPSFPKSRTGTIPDNWHSDNILDKVESFFINNWLHKYSYQTIW